MDGARRDFLAGARLAQQQHGDVRRRHHADLVAQPDRGRPHAHEAGDGVVLRQALHPVQAQHDGAAQHQHLSARDVGRVEPHLAGRRPAVQLDRHARRRQMHDDAVAVAHDPHGIARDRAVAQRQAGLARTVEQRRIAVHFQHAGVADELFADARRVRMPQDRQREQRPRRQALGRQLQCLGVFGGIAHVRYVKDCTLYM
jgi:hypothetical protein